MIREEIRFVLWWWIDVRERPPAPYSSLSPRTLTSPFFSHLQSSFLSFAHPCVMGVRGKGGKGGGGGWKGGGRRGRWRGGTQFDICVPLFVQTIYIVPFCLRDDNVREMGVFVVVKYIKYSIFFSPRTLLDPLCNLVWRFYYFTLPFMTFLLFYVTSYDGASSAVYYRLWWCY